MNRGPARLVGTLAAVAALSVGGASAASAATWIHHDATGDVRTMKADGVITAGRAGDTTPREDRVDITRVRITHGANKVIVRLHTRAGLPHNVGATYRITTGSRQYFLSYATASGFTMTAFIRTQRIGPVYCPHLAGDIEPTQGVLTITVPRGCLGDPAWVRVGVDLATYDRSTMYADDGLSTKLRNMPALSPRIRARA